MSDPPTGTVTFLFTDIEDSTDLLQHLGDIRYADVLAEHRRILQATFQEHGGHEISTRGDSSFVAFGHARDAVAVAVAAQRAIMAHAWPGGVSVRVRIGVHTGEPILVAGDYVGLDVHRAARICAVGHGGQILLSQTTCKLVEYALPEETTLRDLGSHRLRDLEQPVTLSQVLHPDLPADFPFLKSLDAFPNNLSIQLTSFIGREREIAEVKRLLGTTRLLTLTGAGGIGKTRLAIQVAADLMEDYPDGVWMVEMAPLSEPALVPHIVAQVLRVHEQPGRSLTETLVGYLRDKSLLLVLDNCEHLVAECAHLAEAFLGASPHLRLLVTSREALNAAGELTWRVPPLSIPDPQRLPSVEGLVLYGATRLFVDRVVLTQPTFAITTHNAPAIAQACSRLDGIPLAIELAAARAKVLTVEQIAARLDDRFRLLTGGSRTALPRQQTLRAAMDWSYELLSQKERIMFRRLSVFVGGWTLEAAEAVCAGKRIKEPEILELLTRLIDQSLVSVDRRGQVRYRMLETVRQYSKDRLVESGEMGPVRDRHRDFFLQFAELAEPQLTGPGQVTWLHRLEDDHDNLRAALEWTLDRGLGEMALRLSGALWRFWRYHGHFTEARRWLEAALTRGMRAPASLRSKALFGLAVLVMGQGDYGRAKAFCEESLALSRHLEDRKSIADALNAMANMALNQCEYAQAEPYYEESLTLYREEGNKRGIAVVLANQGEMALYQGDYRRARARCEESLTLFRELGDRRAIATCLNTLGDVALSQDDHPQATALLKESLTLNYEVADKEAIAECLEALAVVAVARGATERAARLWGAAEALRDAIGVPLRAPDRAVYERSVAPVRTILGNAEFVAGRARGREMTLEQAITYAREEGQQENRDS